MSDKVVASWLAVDGATRSLYYCNDLDAVNFAANMGAGNLLDDIRTAMEALSLCVLKDQTVGVVQHAGSSTPPTDAGARRTRGVRIFYEDTTNHQISSMTIPAVDDAFLPTVGDLIDFTVTEWATFKTNFEAGAVSRDDNTVSIIKGVAIGRRA